MYPNRHIRRTIDTLLKRKKRGTLSKEGASTLARLMGTYEAVGARRPYEGGM